MGARRGQGEGSACRYTASSATSSPARHRPASSMRTSTSSPSSTSSRSMKATASSRPSVMSPICASSTAIGAHLFKTAQRIEPALEASGLPCDGTNLYLADHPIAGQKVFHVHLHVFPRRCRRRGADQFRPIPVAGAGCARCHRGAAARAYRRRRAAGRRPALDRRRRIHRHDVHDARRRHDRAAHRPVRQQRGGAPGVGRPGAEVGRRRPTSAITSSATDRSSTGSSAVPTPTPISGRPWAAWPRNGSARSSTYDAALEAWRGKAWATADDGHVRFRIERD